MSDPRLDALDALDALAAALARYPGAGALDEALRVYAAGFRGDPVGDEQALIAFANAAPRVFDRAEAVRRRTLRLVAGDARAEGGAEGAAEETAAVAAEHRVAAADLGTLEALFVGPPGDPGGGLFGEHYLRACELTRVLLDVAPLW